MSSAGVDFSVTCALVDLLIAVASVGGIDTVSRDDSLRSACAAAIADPTQAARVLTAIYECGSNITVLAGVQPLDGWDTVIAAPWFDGLRRIQQPAQP